MVRSKVVRLAAVAAFLVGCGGSGGGGSGGAGGNGTGGKATGGHAGGTGGAAGAATGGTAGSTATGGAAGGAGGHANGGTGGGPNGGASGGAAGGANGGAGGHPVAGAGGGGASGTAGAGGQAGGGGAGGAAACNNLVNSGPVVNKDHDPNPTPAMTGGTIADGTYYLTKMVQYNGHNGNTPQQQTWVIAGNSMQVVTLDGHVSGTYTTSGNSLTLTITCPSSMAGQVVFPYTATTTQIVMVNPDDPNEAHTLTLQTNAPGTGGAGGNGGACTSVVASGSPVPEVMGTGTAPTPAGGTVASGLYVLTGWTVYSPATANPSQSRKLTLRITGSTSELQGIDANGATLNLAGTLSFLGPTVTTTWTCGTTGMVGQAYTVSGNQLLIYNPRDGGVEVETWTLQP